MAAQRGKDVRQGVVEKYFRYIRELRSGTSGAVERLVELWDPDGVFEFAGSPPVTGTFKGRQAIHTLYKNRFHASGMPLKLEGKSGAASRRGGPDVALGVVDTEVNRMRILDDKVVAGWTTVVGTTDKRGFQVSGSHTFAFKDGMISSLKVVISPKSDVARNLNIEGLAVNDIGRLALAAWAVV
jgi:hypothetical protein